LCIDFWDITLIMYQNQPDPKVIAAEKSKKELVIKEAKAN
jgi:YidC/Oxa1 family membrane protein insertase